MQKWEVDEWWEDYRCSYLEHRQERGKAAEAVANEIVDEQRIDVDTVSGATNSSIVIKEGG